MSDNDYDFSVVLDDLTTDAQTWRTFAGYLDRNRQLALSVSKIPTFVTDGLSDIIGYTEHYQEMATLVADALSQGTAAMQEIADRLDLVRAAYEQSEEYAKGEVGNV